MSTRKRPRTSNASNPQVFSEERLLEEEDEDELSTPLRTQNTYASSTKKRKLNDTPVSTLSLSRSRRSVGKGEEGVDELAENDDGKAEGSKAGKGNVKRGRSTGVGRGRRGIGRTHVKDVFDLHSSGDDAMDVEEDMPSVKSMLKSKDPVKNGIKRTPNTNGSVRGAQDVNIWDVPDSEDETQKPSAKQSARGKSDTIVAAVDAKPKSSRGPGSSRRKSRAQLEQEQEEEVEEEIAEVEEVIEELPKSSAKSSARGKKRPHPVTSQDEAPRSIASLKKKIGKSVLSSSPVPSPRPNPQSSAKKRGRPRKTLDQLVDEAKAQESPRGILTPSKGRGLKSKKSVVFEQQIDENDLGFKDIPTSAGSKKSRKSIEVATEVERQNDNPDTACGVCSKTKVRKGNEMLLCDGCDYGVHLKCCGLSEIPEGDWFCENCQAAAQSPVEDAEQEVEDVAEEEEDADEVETTTQEAEGDANKDETSCAICSGLDSKIGNKIILCDSCNFAVHVKCYDLPEFPKGDWYCRTCLAIAGEDPFNLGMEKEEIITQHPSDIPDIEGFEEHLQRAQRVVVDKLTGQRKIKLIGHDEEMQKVYQVVEQTVVAGEGNSMLLIGARGCGKTTLVEAVISDVAAEHSEKFHVVRLNGFIHTDDKIASKEIWRQLGREMELEDEGAGKPTNYADTLSTLLALLSHPSEQTSSHSPSQIFSNTQTTKSIVFILDEFDLFTTHSRQTLLYNLFDIAQARKAPIVVLGLTTRIDVVESLEKRVKSRFSHRYVHLGLPRSVPAFWEVCKQGLLISEEEISDDNEIIPGQSEFLEFWNTMVENLYAKDALFKQQLTTTFHRSKSAALFFTSLILPIASLSIKNFPLTSSLMHTSPSLTPPDSKLNLLPSLSTLSLSLLICACRLDIILDSEICNFAMVYDEYSSLTSKHKIQTSASGVNALGGSAKVWGKEVAMAEWERLGEVGLLVPAGVGGGGGMREARKMGRMWKVDVGLEEIAGSVELSGVLGKWCREI